MTFREIVRAGRHPLRASAIGLAVLMLTSQFAMGVAIASAVVGSVGGIALGEWLARSKWRTSFILSTLFASLIVVWLLTGALLGGEFVADALGPGTSLRTFGIIRYFVATLVLVSAVRAATIRKPTFIVIELVGVIASVAFALAAHRDGVIARPLWLSDWAWQAGLDPIHVLLGIGAIAIVVMSLLLLAEREGDVSIASIVALPALALLAMLLFTTSALPAPKPSSDVDLTGRGETPQLPSGDGGVPQQPGNGPDAGGSRDGGSSGGDGGADGSQDPHTTDGGADGGASAGDAGADGGSSAGDAGADGGASGGRDGGADGGSSASDGGADGGSGARDGGSDAGSSSDAGTSPPPSNTSRDGGTSSQPPNRQQRSDEDRNDVREPSSAPMAVVVLDNDYSPPSGAYYFRQGSWSQYNGHRLVETTRNDVDLDIVLEYPTERTRPREVPSPQGRARVSGRVGLIVEHNGPFAIEGLDEFRPSSNPNSTRFVRAFRFVSHAQTVPYQNLMRARVGNPAWSPEIRQYYLEIPADPRYAALANEIVAAMPEARRNDPFARAVAIKLYLDHNLTYSTRHRHAGVDDPVADLLFGDRTGYCVHFAHSAVYLWRAVGIPARVSNGYHSDEQNRRGGSAIMLRGSDAHAWPEVYVEGYGWIILDIAAERNLDPPGQPTDEDLQRMLGDMAREEEEEINDPPENREKPFPWLRVLGYAALWLLAAALVALYTTKLWRVVAPSFATQKSIARLAYRAALDSLSAVGYVRDQSETREQFAARVAEIVPSFTDLTTRNIAAVLRASGTDMSRPEFDVATTRALLSQTRREIRAHVKFTRRLRGVLHPVSFWMSK